LTDLWDEDATRRVKANSIDAAVPTAARVYDYLVGGKNHFAADRKAARALAGTAPLMVAAIAPAVRAFRRRVLRFLVAEAGLRQFIDVGIGLSATGSTHEIAQSIAPGCRVVYVDNDPMVLTHARALMRSATAGTLGYVDADVRDPSAIIAGARATLDLSQPVAVLLLSTLAFIESTAQAAAVVSALMEPMPGGSSVAIWHYASSSDGTSEPGHADAARRWNAIAAQRITLRSRSEVAGLTAGLDLVAPGLVPVTGWRPAADDPRCPDVIPTYGLVARKPSNLPELTRAPW
jgi:hypothetical protein